jgi:hypothetical protein
MATLPLPPRTTRHRMTTDPPILRNSALATPFALAVGALFGWDHVLAAAVSSAVLVGNLWVLSILGPPLVRSLARGTQPALWVAALLAKFVLLFGVYALLFQFLPPLGLGLGVVTLMMGTLLTGLELARRETSNIGEA